MNENDLISRQELQKRLCEDTEEGTFLFTEEQVEAADKIIRYVVKIVHYLPSVDAIPMVHGRWIDKPNPRWPAYDIRYCSVCEWNINKSKLRAKDNWSFCPNCGAKMDLKEQTEGDQSL